MLILLQQQFNPSFSIFTEVDLVWASIWALASYNFISTVVIFYILGVMKGKKKEA